MTFAGATQRLDLATGARDPGMAKALYHLPAKPPEGTDCRSARWRAKVTAPPSAPDRAAAAVVPPSACGWSRVELPYVAQGGWASPAARPWQLVTTSTRFADITLGPGATYQVDSQADESTLGGARPAWRLLDQGNDGAWSTIAVYRWSSGPLRIVRRLTYVRPPADGTGRFRLQAGARLGGSAGR